MVNKLRFIGISSSLVLFLILPGGCRPRDYAEIPAYTKRNFLQAVIEIPAGTSHEIYYCKSTRRFRMKDPDSAAQQVNYLPYPANYGFIPSTWIDNESGENGDFLHVMVISEEEDIGDVVEIIPVGMLILRDDFHTEYQIIAVPADPEEQIVKATTLEELNSHYPSLTGILGDWFLNCGL